MKPVSSLSALASHLRQYRSQLTEENYVHILKQTVAEERSYLTSHPTGEFSNQCFNAFVMRKSQAVPFSISRVIRQTNTYERLAVKYTDKASGYFEQKPEGYQDRAKEALSESRDYYNTHHTYVGLSQDNKVLAKLRSIKGDPYVCVFAEQEVIPEYLKGIDLGLMNVAQVSKAFVVRYISAHLAEPVNRDYSGIRSRQEFKAYEAEVKRQSEQSTDQVKKSLAEHSHQNGERPNAEQPEQAPKPAKDEQLSLFSI